MAPLLTPGPMGQSHPSGTRRNNDKLDRSRCGTRTALLGTVGVLVRRTSATVVPYGTRDLWRRYRVIGRVAPSCYDAEDIGSGAPIRINIASEADSALIDVRFSRARTQLALIDHPCVAQIVDQGVLPSGRPWVASHRPPGTALSSVLARRKLEPHEIEALLSSVAEVLADAHHHQVVHGSLRPHHLTLARGAKVSISGWEWLRTPGIPAFGDPTSTSVFNAPEHDGQSPIDGRADVYALGAIAYRALTGVFPDVSRDLLDARSTLGAIIENMLSIDAHDRATAASVLADLHEQRRAARGSSTERDQRRTDRMSSQAAEEETTERSPPLDPATVVG